MRTIINKKAIVNKLIEIFFFLYTFWNLYPYFVWDTYKNGIFNSIFGINFSTIWFILLSVCSIVYFVKKKRFEQNKIKIAFFTLMIAFTFVCICGGHFENIFSGDWIPYLSIILFILYDDDVELDIFKLYKTVIAITVIPSIIYFILSMLGVNLPYDVLQSYEVAKRGTDMEYISNGYNVYYKHYPFAVQITTFYGSSQYWNLFRLCGIYDEAGRLGTLCALILIIDKYRLKNNWKNIVLFIAGLLSFSLGFILLSAAYFILSNVFNIKKKNFIALSAIVFIYILFLNIKFSLPILQHIQERLTISFSGLAGDNRTNAAFDTLYSDFLNSNLITVLLGTGPGGYAKLLKNYSGVNASTYKTVIIEYGFIGFIIIMLWLLWITIIYINRLKATKKEKEYIIMDINILLCYIINFYQRPSVFYAPFMIIFISGLVQVNKRLIKRRTLCKL